MVLEALEVGVSVLSIDTDVVFWEDPNPYVQKHVHVDIATTQEHFGWMGMNHCAGFYLSNPTSASKELHKKMLTLQGIGMGSNQQIFNHILHNLMRSRITIGTLSPDLFIDGLFYNQNPCCSFQGDPCCGKKRVSFHNDNIFPKPSAKLYRYKELGIWSLDNDR